MKAREIREKSDSELRQILKDRTEAMQRFRMQMVTGQVDNVRAARNARRDIARINTVLRERETAAAGKAV